MDFAWAALPLIVVADELAFAVPAGEPRSPRRCCGRVCGAAQHRSRSRGCACRSTGRKRIAKSVTAGRLSNCRSSIGYSSVCGGRGSCSAIRSAASIRIGSCVRYTARRSCRVSRCGCGTSRVATTRDHPTSCIGSRASGAIASAIGCAGGGGRDGIAGGTGGDTAGRGHAASRSARGSRASGAIASAIGCAGGGGRGGIAA